MSPQEFVDTNIFIRVITRDNPNHAARARAMLDDAETGLITLRTCEGVIVETVQVLDSKKLYNLPRADIRAYLVPILSIRGLKLPNKRVYFAALDTYVATPRLSFVDCLLLAHMTRLGLTTVATFDQGFDHLPGVIRHEPELPRSVDA